MAMPHGCGVSSLGRWAAMTGHQSHANRVNRVQSHFVCLCLSSDGEGESKPAPRCAQTNAATPRPGEIEPLLGIRGSVWRHCSRTAEADARQHRFVWHRSVFCLHVGRLCGRRHEAYVPCPMQPLIITEISGCVKDDRHRMTSGT
ncbi:hypothetical protein FA13DRAFT_156815 [Coprinellus micaceus]|uniref:Uncharacterized protein n=1 Tax=Coprinellus micaceus TaxID=71717 RepID=A0A4Y7TH33_COPMI|nr:hypothetical protein FA13DRAFT_156815 [Coprinellus micaceus]